MWRPQLNRLRFDDDRIGRCLCRMPIARKSNLRRSPVTLHPLDVVVLTHDVPAHGLRRGDLGAVVEVYGPDAMSVEFVAASGRTKAIVTLQPQDLRQAGHDDLISGRPSTSSTNQRDL